MKLLLRGKSPKDSCLALETRLNCCAICFCDWWRRFLYKDLAGCNFIFIFVVRRKTPLHDGTFDLSTL